MTQLEKIYYNSYLQATIILYIICSKLYYDLINKELLNNGRIKL